MRLLLSLLLFGSQAQAAETLLRYDSYATVGDAFFNDFGIVGYLTAGECWATVFEPDEDDYPVKPTELHVLVGGDPDELRATIHIFNYIGIADAAAMNAGLATEIDREEVLLGGNEVTGTMHEVVLAENGFNIDPIEEGTIVVSVCFVNEQYMPMVGMDTNGFESLADTEDTDTASRYMILKGGGGGPWLSLDELSGGGIFLTDYATGGEFPPGDLVMRLVIDTRVSLGGEDEGTTTDAEIYRITPDSQEAGASVPVLIHGNGLDAGATARIGTMDLNAVSVSPFEGECLTGACCVADSCYDYTYDQCKDAKGSSFQLGVSCMSNIVACADDRNEVGACADLLNGKTDKALEPGVYDVSITTASGDEVLLVGAYTVAEVKGCECSSSARSPAAVWWLGLVGLLWRRRQD
jgi:MYXO-CTERM domain-containing protein